MTRSSIYIHKDSFLFALNSPVLRLTFGGDFLVGSTNPTRGDVTFGGPNHVCGNTHLYPQLLGLRHRIQVSFLGGHPTCRLLATRRSLEREIPSWQLPVTFEFELGPGLEPLIAGGITHEDVRLNLDHWTNRVTFMWM